MADRLTARLRLAIATLDDVDALHALDADPGALRYLDPTTRERVAEKVADRRRRIWVAFEGDELIGTFSLRWGLDVGDVELGYRLRPIAWGPHGLATEGARAVLGCAFAELGARRVFAQTMAVNAPSRRVMERCGMRYVRTFHLMWPDPLPGTAHGEVEYELLRADWFSDRDERGTRRHR